MKKRLRQTEVRERLFAEVSLLLHILCFANDFVLITKTAYECKHSTYIYLFFITLNSLYVEASGDLFVHYIVNHALFGFYI